MSYNLCEGGKGGFSYINTNLPPAMKGKRQTDYQKQKASEWVKSNRHVYDTDRYRKAMSLNGQKSSGFSGKTHSEENKKKHSEIMKIQQAGSKNSQFGTMWITDGVSNRKINKDVDILPEGWYKGRIKNYG